MGRLTKKDENGFLILPNAKLIRDTNVLSDYANKLCQKEDDDEKLGIDSHVFIEALISGIHIIDDGYPYNDIVDLIYSLGIPCGFKGKMSDHCVFFKDYGRTWCLTKEGLKNE